MMTHNWFFKALPLILAGPGGSLRWEKICIYMDTVITTQAGTRTQMALRVMDL